MASVDRPQPASGHRSGRFPFAALILANIFLAFGPWMVRLADVGPVAAAFWRVLIAAPFLLLLSVPAWKKGLTLERTVLLMVLAGGVLFAADLATWHYGILHTKLANATLLGNSSSFIFPVYGFIVLRAWPKPMQVGALLLAFVGALLLVGQSYELSAAHARGDLFAILASIFYTCYLIVVDRARRTLAPMPILALATVASILPLLLFALALGEKVMPHSWTPLLLLSLGSQVIGQGLLVYAIGHMRPLIVGLALFTQPAVTAMIGWIVYREALSVSDLIGAVLICIAIVLIRLPSERDLDSTRDEPHLGKVRRGS
jgi:drug/metabolite transporter (DMT)-like permease